MQEREHDLLQPARVADDDAWDVRRGLEGKVEALGPGALCNEADTALDAGAHVEGMKGKLERAALYGCGVKDVVHQPRDLLGSNLDDRGELALFVGDGAGGQQAGGSDHRIQLVPHLVAEVSQQLGIQHAWVWGTVGAGTFYHRFRNFFRHGQYS